MNQVIEEKINKITQIPSRTKGCSLGYRDKNDKGPK